MLSVIMSVNQLVVKLAVGSSMIMKLTKIADIISLALSFLMSMKGREGTC